MVEKTIGERVSALERAVADTVSVQDLERVQATIGAQILQLGTEMHAGFSALQGEVRAGDEETRRVLGEQIRAADEETRRMVGDAIRAGDQETLGAMEERTGEITAFVGKQIEDTRRQARILHEQALAAIRTIAKG